MARKVFILVVVVVAGLVGANSHAQTAQARHARLSGCEPAAPSRSGSTGSLAAIQNAFGFSLFDALFAGHAQSNVFLSPASVALALDMAYDGARDGTQQAMARTLGLQGMGQAQVRQRAAALLTAWQTAPGSEGLTVANSLWARAGIPFRPQFLQDTKRFYGARVSSLDFHSPSAPATINAWVSCATNGKIASIVNSIPPSIVMYLLNAVYFHGDWAAPFNSAATRPQPFTRGDGSQVTVPLMQNTSRFPYYHAANFEAITLPYHTARFSMTVLLPSKGVTLASLGRRLTAAQWQSWTSHFQMQYGSLALPRFSLANDLQLNAPLRALGMGQALDTHADFSGICQQRCRISSVRHKTYLNVDEKGTTAAGVTSIGVGITAVQTPHFHMVVDRPFLVSIQDSTTGSVLFFGAVNNPA